MQTRYENEYHSETGSTQQGSSEDQMQQDLYMERVYDVINTPAVVYSTTTTNREEISTEQSTHSATELHQMSKNDPPSHRDVENVESHSNRQNQTRLDDRNQDDLTNTHIYHILEHQSEEHVELKEHKQEAENEDPVTHIYHILEQQSEEHVELKDHKQEAEYEDPVTHIYHILEQQSEEHVELKDHKPAAEHEDSVTSMTVSQPEL